MVAQGDHVVARGVHHLDGGGALGHADVGGALAEIAGVHQQHVAGAGIQELLLQRGHVGIAVDRAVHVVGMQYDRLAGVFGGNGLDRRQQAGIVVREGGRAHGEGQCQHQKQGQQFLAHVDSLPFTYLVHTYPIYRINDFRRNCKKKMPAARLTLRCRYFFILRLRRRPAHRGGYPPGRPSRARPRARALRRIRSRPFPRRPCCP